MHCCVQVQPQRAAVGCVAVTFSTLPSEDYAHFVWLPFIPASPWQLTKAQERHAGTHLNPGSNYIFLIWQQTCNDQFLKIEFLYNTELNFSNGKPLPILN